MCELYCVAQGSNISSTRLILEGRGSVVTSFYAFSVMSLVEVSFSVPVHTSA